MRDDRPGAGRALRWRMGRAGLGWGVLLCLAAGCGDGVTAPDLPPDTELRFTTPPSHVVVNRVLPTPSVQLYDARRNVRLDLNDVHIRLRVVDASGRARLLGDTVVASYHGLARFANVRADHPARSVRLEATVVGAGLSVLSRPFDIVDAPDVIELENVSSAVVRVLVDGEGWDGFENDRMIVATPGQPVELIMDRSNESNDVVVFENGRAPTLVPNVGWTRGVDTVRIRLRDPVHLPLAVWLVGGRRDAEAPATVFQALAIAQEIFDSAGVGIEFDPVELIDVRTSDRASDFSAYDALGDGERIEDAIGQRFGIINAYIVDSIYAGGRQVGGIAAGLPGVGLKYLPATTLGRLWAHEFGHVFALGHVRMSPGFPMPEDNLMGGGAGLTEGQLFRMNFDVTSGLNALYGLGPPGVRYCTFVGGTPACPWIGLSFP